MLGFVDIHSHILPGVDDGAGDIEEAICMLAIAYEQGIRIMIATPHYSAGRDNIAADELKKITKEVGLAVHNAGLDIQLVLGNELLYSMDLVDALDKGEALTMDGTRYILVEFLPSTSFQEIKSGLNHCIYSGYIPILAHAERYRSLRAQPERVEELIRLGVYIQLNLSSLVGGIAKQSVHFAHKLIKRGWVHFLGTDAHGVERRPPVIENALGYLYRRYGEDIIQQLLWDNPLRMLEDKPL
ncbi:MAG: hypothetical protein E7255_02770 [Lachnospiraceae bacterium]|nr:hypothetical protein [Lachnospiraceae bacterium]